MSNPNFFVHVASTPICTHVSIVKPMEIHAAAHTGRLQRAKSTPGVASHGGFEPPAVVCILLSVLDSDARTEDS